MIILKLYIATALPTTLLKNLMKAYSFWSIIILQHTAIVSSLVIPVEANYHFITCFGSLMTKMPLLIKLVKI